MIKRIAIGFCAIAMMALAACERPADVASRNLSTAADNFQIDRRVVFYDGINGTYLLSIEGRCSLGNFDSYRQLSVTCQTGPTEFKKHFLGLSDNVTYFVEQLAPSNVSTYRYKVVFNPTTILPDVDLHQ